MKSPHDILLTIITVKSTVLSVMFRKGKFNTLFRDQDISFNEKKDQETFQTTTKDVYTQD